MMRKVMKLVMALLIGTVLLPSCSSGDAKKMNGTWKDQYGITHVYRQLGELGGLRQVLSQHIVDYWLVRNGKLYYYLHGDKYELEGEPLNITFDGNTATLSSETGAYKVILTKESNSAEFLNPYKTEDGFDEGWQYGGDEPGGDE